MAATDRLAELLDAHLSAGLADFAPSAPVIEGALVVPGMTTLERTELAELLSGTTDKRSRSYKAARRNVERWEKGQRKPGKRSVERIRSARRQQDATLRAYRQHGGSIRLTFSWYAKRRQETRPDGRRLHIPRETMRRVIKDWADGDNQLAAGRLFDEFLVQYNVPNPDDWAAEVTVTGLDLRPGE